MSLFLKTLLTTELHGVITEFHRVNFKYLPAGADLQSVPRIIWQQLQIGASDIIPKVFQSLEKINKT
jgi:hypothetical protein